MSIALKNLKREIIWPNLMDLYTQYFAGSGSPCHDDELFHF